MQAERSNTSEKQSKYQAWSELWLVIVLLSTVFFACLITIIIAINHPDQPAVGQYKKVGLSIERVDIQKKQEEKLKVSYENT